MLLDASRDGASMLKCDLIIRPHDPADIDWIVRRHAIVYAEEHGWDGSFRKAVAASARQIERRFRPDRERIFIAERSGDRAGSIAIVGCDATTARLRLFLVEPKVRGLGVGRRLLEEGLAFARAAAYARITLTTLDCLIAARHLYRSSGFGLAGTEPRHVYGHDLVEERWQRDV